MKRFRNTLAAIKKGDDMGIHEFLAKTLNGEMGKSISELPFEHLDVLLSIWHINRRSDGCSQTEMEISKAFGGEGEYKYEESCVQDLFRWKILDWIKEGETFRINPALDDSLDEIIAAWQKLKPNKEG